MSTMCLNNSVQENVNASRVVKAFVREDYEVKKFHGISQYVYTSVHKGREDCCMELTGNAVRTMYTVVTPDCI